MKLKELLKKELRAIAKRALQVVARHEHQWCTQTGGHTGPRPALPHVTGLHMTSTQDGLVAANGAEPSVESNASVDDDATNGAASAGPEDGRCGACSLTESRPAWLCAMHTACVQLSRHTRSRHV